MGTTARTATLAAIFGALTVATAGCSADFLSVSSSTVPVVQPRPAATDRLHLQAQ